MEPRRLLIALNAADTVTRAALCRLGAAVEEWVGVRLRDVDAAARALGVPAKQLARAIDLRARAAEIADAELAAAERRGYRIATLCDPDYPAPLRDHPLPPPVLYWRGELPRGPAVAIVGSRRMDAYGAEVATLFGRGLAAAGVTVVSGFALGVDAAAHRAALDAPGGRTVAVLGCGLDVCYPRRNARLGDEIAERGAVVSEFALGAEPLPWRFPIRNRIIAALARATLVVQAALGSGSLITAHQALELGRDVYAVPGGIFDELALGTNALIADGALVARTPEDLLERTPLPRQQELFPAQHAAGTTPEKTPRTAPPAKVAGGSSGEATGTEPGAAAGWEARVLAEVPRGDGRSVEDIATALAHPVDRVLAALLELELAGWVKRLPGPSYAR